MSDQNQDTLVAAKANLAVARAALEAELQSRLDTICKDLEAQGYKVSCLRIFADKSTFRFDLTL